jgi:NitT/TauT family transport system permease protein
VGDRLLAGSDVAVTAAAPAARPAKVRRRPDWTDLLVKLLAVATLLAVWEGLSLLYPPTFLPGPALVLGQVAELIQSGDLVAQAVPTVLRVLIGFILALMAGSAVGIAMGVQRRIESFLEGYILLGLTVPGLAWSVLALMWFGIGEVAPVFAVFVVVSPMIAVNMWHGTKAIDPELNEMQRAFGASRFSLVRDVIVPQLLPYLFGASRFGFGLGWKVVVISEMFGLTSGIGYQINRAFALYSMRGVLAWTIGFALIMVVFEYGLLRPLERQFLRWRPSLRV